MFNITVRKLLLTKSPQFFKKEKKIKYRQLLKLGIFLEERSSLSQLTI